MSPIVTTTTITNKYRTHTHACRFFAVKNRDCNFFFIPPSNYLLTTTTTYTHTTITGLLHTSIFLSSKSKIQLQKQKPSEI